MNTLSRRNTEFTDRINKKFNYQISFLNKPNKSLLTDIHNIETTSTSAIHDTYYKDLRKLKQNYYKQLEVHFAKRNELIQQLPSINSKPIRFWLKALINSKATSELITEADWLPLESLVNIRFEYLDVEVSESFKLVFEFKENEFIENKALEKEYHLTNDKLIERIVSSDIRWKEGKNYAQRKVKKTYRNKKTNEIKVIDINTMNPSFFNFFCNITLPQTQEQMKCITYKEEKMLYERLDKEYEIANEIIDEIIPHASEYYCGCLQDIEEHTNYVEKHFISDFPL